MGRGLGDGGVGDADGVVEHLIQEVGPEIAVMGEVVEKEDFDHAHLVQSGSGVTFGMSFRRRAGYL